MALALVNLITGTTLGFKEEGIQIYLKKENCNGKYPENWDL